MEMIIEHYQVKEYPRYLHFSFCSRRCFLRNPIKKGLSVLLGKTDCIRETTLASEGFSAIAPAVPAGSTLIINNNIFFEFVPVQMNNFDADGKMVDPK